MYRTARCGLRVTRGQRRRLLGLLRSAGDVWSCVLELNAWRRASRTGRWPPTGSRAGNWPPPGRGPSASWIPRVPGRCCAATATRGSRPLSAARAGICRRGSRGGEGGWCRCAGTRARSRWTPGAAPPGREGLPAAGVRLDRDVPYPAGQVRSVTLLFDGRRLQVDVTAEVPVACYPGGRAPDPERVAGMDLGIIHPYAVAGPDGQGLLVSGRAVRAECRLHLRDSKARARAAARRARNRAAGVTAVAAAPPPPAGRRGPSCAACPPGPARSRQVRGGLGGEAAGRYADRGRPSRRLAASRRAGAPKAAAGLADRAPDVGAAGQGRGRRDHREGDR